MMHFNVISRPELIDKIGEYFIKKCDHCNHQDEYHVNDVQAENTNIIRKVGVITGVVVIIIGTLFAMIKGILTNVAFIVGGLIIIASQLASNNSNAKIFNRYKVRQVNKK